MEKNVEFTVSGIKCDNPSCDYKDMGVKFEDYPDYINKPCPKCGSVLLTQEDHDKCLMFQQIADTINAIPEEQLKEMSNNLSPEEIKKGFQLLKDLEIQYEIKFTVEKNQLVTCRNVDRLPGNSIAPELELNKEYPVLDVILCDCGKEHYDVGLKSEHNYISCWDCKKPLRDGDKIHWCHPSRFEINKK